MGNYGLFTTDERRRLISSGIELTFDADMEEFVELSYAYKTLLSASERLYVSYSLFDAKGAPLAPSRIVSELKRLFVHIKTQVCKEDTLLLVQNIQTALGAYASHFYEDTPVRAALQKLIQQDPQAKERVCAFENAANATHFAMNSQQAIQAVYGENLYLSPSRIESFHRCRFAYFLR